MKQRFQEPTRSNDDNQVHPRRSIAVIISSFNYERYVAETIESVLNQSRPADEIFVVDDGSVDGSVQIIEAYRDRLTFIQKRNGGQASALNAGFNASVSEIILFLDSDDRLTPDCLQVIEQVWQDGCSKIHFGLSIIDENGSKLGGFRPAGPLPSGDLRSTILHDGGYKTAPTSGNAFARSALKSIMPIDEDAWRTYADCPLLFLVPFFGSVIAVNRALGEYRVHACNASGLVRDGNVQIGAFRSEIVRDLRQNKLLTKFCQSLNLDYRADAVLLNWYSCKLRVVSLRIDPDHHPLQTDTRISLARNALRSLWVNGYVAPVRKRSLMTIWVLLILWLPRPFAKRFSRLAYARPDAGGFAA